MGKSEDVPPSIFDSHKIDIESLAAHQSTLVRLEKRIREVELHCKRSKWGASTAEAAKQFGDGSDIMEDTLVDTPEMKDVHPRILASQVTNSISAAHESTLVRLEERMQEVELHCQRALHALKVR